MKNDLVKTICIENHLINEDCYTKNLEAFRCFRETNLTDEENIHYDMVSPQIINGLYEEDNYKEVFALLYKNFVQKLTNYINELEIEKAKNLFTIYLTNLENVYIKNNNLDIKKTK